MPHIVNYQTKKAFKEAVLANPSMVWCEDPSIFSGSYSGFVVDVLRVKGEFTVTNHPKRSWFARVYLKGGQVRVE